MGWPSGQVGGLNRYLAELFTALERAGAAPSAVVVGPAPDAPAGVAVAADARSPLPRRLLAYARAARRPADVIDAHFALYALLPVLLRSRGVPLVVHFQGPWADESAAAGGANLLAVTVKRSWERAVYRRAERIVTLTSAFRRILVERYGIAPWMIEAIPPSVDLERFSPGDRQAARARLGLPAGAWIAVTARRLVPRMGIDVLLEAWAGVGEGALLLVVGGGPDRVRLEALAGEPGLAGRVRFAGRVDDAELADCYRAADVCVVPSLALEGYGLVVLEALACGTPVVTSDAGGLPEAVSSLDPGLVVPAGDADMLAERLGDARSGVRPLPARSACRAHAERHSPELLATRHLALYRDVLDRARRCTRVVYVDHTARLSGGELALLRLLPALRNVDAHVILGEDGPLVARLTQAGISVEVLPLSSRSGRLARERVAPGVELVLAAFSAGVYSLRLARRLRRLRPDLVHTNSLKSAFYAGVAARLARIPVVWHLRDRIADDYLPPLAVRTVRRVARTLPAAVVANSRTTLETLRGSQPAIAAAIASPVPTPAAVHSVRDDRDALLVAIVGRIAPWKGQHVFLEAFARAFPAGEARAVVAGVPLFGEEAYAQDLRARARQLAIAGRVEFAGFVEDVPSLIASVDVLVHASVKPEPFGQVVVEALAGGTPVIAANAGGPAEIVTDGVDGLLYTPGDVAELADCLLRAAGDPNLRRRLSAAGRARALAFTPDRIAEAIGDVYTRVLAESPR